MKFTRQSISVRWKLKPGATMTFQNKFSRKPKVPRLYIQCESTGGNISNQNLRERAQEMIERINIKSKKLPVLELLPEEASRDKYL